MTGENVPAREGPGNAATCNRHIARCTAERPRLRWHVDVAVQLEGSPAPKWDEELEVEPVRAPAGDASV